MLYGSKSKEELNTYVEKLIMENVVTRKNHRDFYSHLKRKFNISESLAADIITFKKDMAEFTPFQLFAVVYCLKPEALPKFFTETEIANFSASKMEENETITFPITIPMMQISDSQWIGATDLQQLMTLRKARMLNYDENEQRALQIIKKGETIIRKPFVNRKAVAEIRESMENGTYVSDAITLNMTDNADYSYDEKKHILTIHSLPKGMFNLIDGYHRTLAMSEINQFNPEFNLPMELRVVAFSPEEATAFIFQQDKKTLMKKVVSDSYDPYSIVNRIITRVNRSPEFLMQNEIGRNGSCIDMATLGKLIEAHYMKEKIKRENIPEFVRNTSIELIDKFNALITQIPSLSSGFSDIQLFIAMYLFTKDKIKTKDYGKIFNRLNNLSDEEKKYMKITDRGYVRRKGISILDEKLEGR